MKTASLVALVFAAMQLAVPAHAAYYWDADTASVSFSGAASYDVTFSWQDAMLERPRSAAVELDGRYAWAMFDLTAGTLSEFALNVPDAVTGDIGGLAAGSFSRTFSSLDAGHEYELVFGGYWGGLAGPLYHLSAGTGEVSLAVAAVPEPETCAMLLAGLGLIAVSARRRKP
jgi:hypothetical protein